MAEGKTITIVQKGIQGKKSIIFEVSCDMYRSRGTLEFQFTNGLMAASIDFDVLGVSHQEFDLTNELEFNTTYNLVVYNYGYLEDETGEMKAGNATVSPSSITLTTPPSYAGYLSINTTPEIDN